MEKAKQGEGILQPTDPFPKTQPERQNEIEALQQKVSLVFQSDSIHLCILKRIHNPHSFVFILDLRTISITAGSFHETDPRRSG